MNAIQAYQPQTIDDVQRTAKLLAASGYFETAKDMQIAVAQIATQIMAGSEMGMGPFTSVYSIHVIKGKPTMSANAMAAAVKAHPAYDYRVRQNDNTCVKIEYFQHGESIGISEFTAADAKAAGTQNMGKYPRNMLFARAMSNGVKWYTPDVFFGNAVYTPDELDANALPDDDYATRIIDDSTGEIVDVQIDDAPDDTAAHLAEPERTNGNGTAPQFKNPDEAKAYAVSVGAYTADEVNDAYSALRTEVKELHGDKATAGIMYAAWLEDVGKKAARQSIVNDIEQSV